jgi:response regulator RpfG family c-di-GMP phosphodiesterase
VDVWEVLRSARPYRDPWPEQKARQYIEEQAGIEFDPAIVQLFLDLL